MRPWCWPRGRPAGRQAFLCAATQPPPARHGSFRAPRRKDHQPPEPAALSVVTRCTARADRRTALWPQIMVRPSCSAKSAKSLALSVASGIPSTRQQAAIQVSLWGRGRPRSCARAWSWPPLVRHGFVVGQDSNPLTPPGQVGGAARPPAPYDLPLHQLPDRDECDSHRVARQRSPHAVGQAISQGGRRDVGVEDD